MALGYDVWKISAGCLVISIFAVHNLSAVVVNHCLVDNCAQIPVCSECMMCVHKAPEHACDRIIDIEAKQLKDMKALVVDAQAKVKACEEVSTNLENVLSTLQEQKDTAHARILEAFKTYTALLDKRQVYYCHCLLYQRQQEKTGAPFSPPLC